MCDGYPWFAEFIAQTARHDRAIDIAQEAGVRTSESCGIMTKRGPINPRV
jgi:hypothetical protein